MRDRTSQSLVYSEKQPHPKQNASAMQLSKTLDRSANLLATFEARKKEKAKGRAIIARVHGHVVQTLDLAMKPILLPLGSAA